MCTCRLRAHHPPEGNPTGVLWISSRCGALHPQGLPTGDISGGHESAFHSLLKILILPLVFMPFKSGNEFYNFSSGAQLVARVVKLNFINISCWDQGKSIKKAERERERKRRERSKGNTEARQPRRRSPAQRRPWPCKCRRWGVLGASFACCSPSSSSCRTPRPNATSRLKVSVEVRWEEADGKKRPQLSPGRWGSVLSACKAQEGLL